MSQVLRTASESGVRLHEMRRYQVYRLERPRRRSLLARLRRSVRDLLPR